MVRIQSAFIERSERRFRAAVATLRNAAQHAAAPLGLSVTRDGYLPCTAAATFAATRERWRLTCTPGLAAAAPSAAMLVLPKKIVPVDRGRACRAHRVYPSRVHFLKQINDRHALGFIEIAKRMLRNCMRKRNGLGNELGARRRQHDNDLALIVGVMRCLNQLAQLQSLDNTAHGRRIDHRDIGDVTQRTRLMFANRTHDDKLRDRQFFVRDILLENRDVPLIRLAQ